MSRKDRKRISEHIGRLSIKQPYSKTRYVSVHFRGYVDLLRPFTLLAPFIVSMCVITASLVYNKIPAADNWWVTVGQASFTLALVNAASNALNQATDHEADKISKPWRPIPKKILKPDEAQSLAYLLYLFALLRAVTINFWFGTFVFLIMVFTVTYSLPPRIKKYLFLNQIWIAIPRGMLGILASWSVFVPEGQHPFTATPITIGAIATAYLIGGMATKDIVDSKADKMTGTHTMINTYGVKKTALFSLPFMVFPFLLIPILVENGFLESYLEPLFFLFLPTLLIIYLMIKGHEVKSMENVPAWGLMYIVYIFFALGFSLLIIFQGVIDFPLIFS
jgi:geranylgeranylglycerol-phosphate geranylgeranyltransferase